ncbi:MAG: glycerol-3-phosphate 1-O-acyltransferase PlsY [Nitrospiraceae bacterium]|nr:glycerol-3-phosphate 1-O-acyltransferase PlsY [Nitrospiraceae bacterium]
MTILALILSYLGGSIPTGLWLGLELRGIDIREHGSKNIGATNTMRVLGKKLGALALIGDAAKGVAAVLLFARLGTWEYLPLACGMAAIVGHTASIFCRFRGGKGVATAAGVFLALYPVHFAAAVTLFAMVVAATRMVSAASMCAALTLCAAMYATHTPWPVRAVTTVLAVFVIWKHRTNIGRILKGEENRLW